MKFLRIWWVPQRKISIAKIEVELIFGGAETEGELTSGGAENEGDLTSRGVGSLESSENEGDATWLEDSYFFNRGT